jgi:hypothetical protein
VVPGCIALGIAAASTNGLLRARLYLSEAALVSAAPMLATDVGSGTGSNGRWVGLFQVRRFEQYGTELRFVTTGCGVVSSCGVVYSPSGEPPHRGEDVFVHLYGPWWHWYHSW